MVMKLEELNVYTISMAIAEKVWQIVMSWDYFAKDTIGKQVVRSSDSIAANISEGFGRYHFKDSKHFLYYSRGSLCETQTWLTKAYNRKLIGKDSYDQLMVELKELAIKLNNYINSIGKYSTS
ncbi:MAG: four helix bundle protein [Bacteroidales bacterium]|nr:MAG: four helix bundle protein [Bacteroidales bacterium]